MEGKGEVELLIKDLSELHKKNKGLKFEAIATKKGNNKGKGTTIAFQNYDKVEDVNNALQKNKIDSMLILCRVDSSKATQKLLQVKRSEEEMRIFTQIHCSLHKPVNTQIIEVIKWFALNKVDFVESTFYISLTEDLALQKKNMKEYIAIFSKEQNNVQQRLHMRVAGQTTDKVLKQKFEKFVLKYTIGLYRGGMNIVKLKLTLPSISKNLEERWKLLGEEGKKSNTFYTSIKLIPGTQEISVEIAQQFLSNFPHRDCQLKLPGTEIYKSFNYNNIQSIGIYIRDEGILKTTFFGNGERLQLKGVFDDVPKIFKTCVCLHEVSKIDFTFFDRKGNIKEYSTIERKHLFNLLKEHMPKFKQVKRILINNVNIMKVTGGKEVMEWIKQNPSNAKQFDCFIAHEWGPADSGYPIHEVAKELKKKLTKAGLNVWLDDTNLKHSVAPDITKGLENSETIILLLTKMYFERCADKTTNAHKEIVHAARVTKGKEENLIPLVLDKELLDPSKWYGTLAYYLPDTLYIDFTSKKSRVSNFPQLVERVNELKTKEQI